MFSTPSPDQLRALINDQAYRHEGVSQTVEREGVEREGDGWWEAGGRDKTQEWADRLRALAFPPLPPDLS